MIILKDRDRAYYDLMQKEIKKLLPEGGEGKVYELSIARAKGGFKIACMETGGVVKQRPFQLISELRRVKKK